MLRLTLLLILLPLSLAVGACGFDPLTGKPTGFKDPQSMTAEELCANARYVVYTMQLTNVPRLYPQAYAAAEESVVALCQGL